MEVVYLTALAVGGTTIIGALLGLLFKNITHRFSDLTTAFAAGIMLCAAINGLISHSIDYSDSVWITIIGIFCGAVIIALLDKLIPHLHRISDVDLEAHGAGNEGFSKVILFIVAMAMHDFPEGIAAGVGFGTGMNETALTIAGGIALQNIPEGMVVIAPMLAAGMKPWRAFVIAAGIGILEGVGTLIGYFAISISGSFLAFALAFAGGTMLYLISDEMIPETHHGDARGVTFALLAGFAIMLLIEFYIG